jgi:hypothetical protein
VLAKRLAVVAVAAVVACDANGSQRGSGFDARRADSTAVSPASGGRTASSQVAGVEAIPVNRGTHGMRATVRWVLSPDRRSIVVVEDPVSVEADALPDGFLYGSEATGAIVQMDSVWDVAPSPDWTRIAYGRAFVARAGEGDTVPETEWVRLEARLPEDVAMRDSRSLRRVLQAHAFPASGMVAMLGLGLAQVIWLDKLGAGRNPTATGPTHSLNGWRVRWTRGGDTLAVGAAPRAVQDDAPPTRWTLVRPRLWAVFSDTLGGTTDSSSFAPVGWVVGPTMVLGTRPDRTAGRPIAIDRGTIEWRDGTIRITRRGVDGRQHARVVGPGFPLAATASGRFIVAIVPHVGGPPSGMQAQTIVYHVPPE